MVITISGYTTNGSQIESFWETLINFRVLFQTAKIVHPVTRLLKLPPRHNVAHTCLFLPHLQLKHLFVLLTILHYMQLKLWHLLVMTLFACNQYHFMLFYYPSSHVFRADVIPSLNELVSVIRYYNKNVAKDTALLLDVFSSMQCFTAK